MTKKEKSNELVPVATTARNVIESYIFATGHQNLSIYSERLLMQLVKAAQCQVNGLNFRDGSAISQVSIGPLGEAVVEIEAKELLSGDKNTNYSHAKKAVLELMNKSISHERPAFKNGEPIIDEDGDQVYQFEAHTLVNDVYINQKPGVIIVNVNKATWEAILDFSKGFRRYDLQAAMKFSRTYSLRMFKLISNQQCPLSFTIDELREQWGLKDKYKTTKDFIKNTIESAKKELDRVSPWTFDYVQGFANTAEQNKGRKGRKSITSITFFPKHQLKFESASSVSAMASPSMMLGKPVIDRLVKNLGFSMAEIKANMVLFTTSIKYFELEDFLISITPSASRAQNTQGYVINALKTHLKEKYNVIVKKNEFLAEEPETAKIVAPLVDKTDTAPVMNTIFSSENLTKQNYFDRKDKEASLGEIMGNLFTEQSE